MKDDLGNRMKAFYENITRMFLPRRTYTIIRLDGKSFHTFTKGLDKPWDADLTLLMDGVTDYLCKNIQGAKFGYTQSDEISIVFTDFDKLETDAWFGGNIQKIASVAASMATYAFMAGMFALDMSKFNKKDGTIKEAVFDARVFTITSRTEVINYFIWRQKDAIRNSISMLAQHMFSAAELKGKNQKTMIEMCANHGQRWDDLAVSLKRGRSFYLDVKQTMSADSFDQEVYETKTWMYDDAPPIFTEDRNYIQKVLPKLSQD